MKVALVTGSREWTDEDLIYSELDKFEPDVLIHGDCPRGLRRCSFTLGSHSMTHRQRSGELGQELHRTIGNRRISPEDTLGLEYVYELYAADAEDEEERLVTPGDLRVLSVWLKELLEYRRAH